MHLSINLSIYICTFVKFRLLLLSFSPSVMPNALWPHGPQHAVQETRLPCPSLSPRACSNSCPLSCWCPPTILSSVVPFSSCLYLSQHQGLFQWVCSSHQVAEVLELQLQHQSLQWINSVQSFSRVWLFAIPWTAARQASLSITNSWSLLKLISIKSVMLFNYLILFCLLLPLPSIFPQIRVFSTESVLCIRWPKFWSFSYSICPSNEYSGLISFRIGWFDLHAVQGTLKSLLQHHSSKASILRCSAFFMVQLSHPHMTTGKNIALTRWTFVNKVISLLFNMLSRSSNLFFQEASFNFTAAVTICSNFGAPKM